MPHANWPDGYEVIKDNVIPLHLEPIELPAQPIVDAASDNGEAQRARVLASFRAVGAVSNKRYLSGRVIPAEQQMDALERAQACQRQMTAFEGHPSVGINCAAHEEVTGRTQECAALVPAYHYDPMTGQTILDRIDVLDVAKGREFLERYEAGILFGISQRALGKQEPCKLEVDGEEMMCLVVTDLAEIFGWDFVHLDTANAGHVTKIEPIPLTDQALRSLAALPDRAVHSNTQEQNAMGKQFKSANDPKQTSQQPINDQQQQPAAPSPKSDDAPIKDDEQGAKEKEAEARGARFADENAKLLDTIDTLGKKIDDVLGGFKSINDDFKGRFMTAKAEEDLYNDVYRAARIAVSEAWRCNADESLTAAEKNAKLQELLVQMKECFDKISEAYIAAQLRDESDGGPAADGAMGDQARPSADVVPLHDANRDDGDQPIEYVPPTQPETEEPIVDKADEAITSSAALRDSVAELLKVREQKRALCDMRSYAEDAVGRQKLADDAHKKVFAIVDKAIHPSITKEQIEEVVKDAVGLVKTGQVQERLSGMGLDQPQGAGMSRISDVKAVHSLGADHLAGVKVLTDSLQRTGNYSLSMPEATKVPSRIQAVLDAYDQIFAPQLARERQLIMDKLKLQKGDSKVFDASTAADFDTPATIGRMVLFESYANNILPEITDFGTMDNDRSAIPITRWRRDNSAQSSTFRPSVLQRHSVRVGELSPMVAGKLTTEFFNIDAESRKMQTTLSREFLTRAKRRPDLNGMAMALKALEDEIKRILLMDVFFEQIRAAAFHGATTFDVEINGTSTSVYRTLGTNDADTTTIVPHDERSPLVVYLGTTNANRTVVPEYGSQSTGGGPGNAYFYVIEPATS